MSRFVAIWGAVFIALLCSQSLRADDMDEVAKVFSHKTLKADFIQQVLDQRQRVQQTMRGRLALSRPGKFRWSYQSPYEQEIVADGNKVWLYDVDLEQVTVKAQDQTLNGTPAVLLSSSNKWREQFDVKKAGREGSLTWYKLTPRKEDGAFEYLALGVSGGSLERLEIQDNFGQLTTVEFSHLQTDVKLDPETFVFELPEDVDVIDETDY